MYNRSTGDTLGLTMSTTSSGDDHNCDLPDIANEPHSGPNATLNWVGMSEIELPVHVLNGKGEKIQTVASVQAYVNLIDPEAKGIHMSRLYLAIDQILSDHTITPALLEEVVTHFSESQEGISDSAYLECRLQFFERRNSLISDNTGWKSYKTRISSSVRQGEISTELSIEIPYSSTCPCSAALARDIIQATPVQAAVKREDEQEFARLNASNLMFCEDAARRVQAILANDQHFEDFWVRVNHLESLHPHDAVAIVTKGVEGGYRDDPREFPH